MFKVTFGGFEYEVILKPVIEELKIPEVKYWLNECENKIKEGFFENVTGDPWNDQT